MTKLQIDAGRNILAVNPLSDDVPDGGKIVIVSDVEGAKIGQQNARYKLNFDMETIEVTPIAIPVNPVRTAILAVAQSTVGVQLNLLTPVQVRALMACLLYAQGGVHPDMTVAPLAEWLQ